MAFTRTWDETAPLGTAAANTLETIIQQFKTDIRERVPPKLTLTAAAEAGDARVVTIQAKDINGTNWSETRLMFRVWISDSEYGEVTTTLLPTVTVSSGSEIECLGNYQYLICAGATGAATITITISGAATMYVMAECDGRVYSSGAVTFAA